MKGSFPHSAPAGDTTPNSDSCLLLYTSATRKEEGWIKKRKVMNGEEGMRASSWQPTEVVKEPCLYFHIQLKAAAPLSMGIPEMGVLSVS